MLKRLFPIAIWFFVLTLNSFSQNFTLSIENSVFINDSSYEFDVIIKSDSNSFVLTSYQGIIICNLNSAHQLRFSYINNSSELINHPSFAIGITTDTNNVTRLLTFASNVGKDNIGTNELRVGRFLLTSSNTLPNDSPFLYWEINGYIQTLLTGTSFTNITSGGMFKPLHFNNVAIDKQASQNDTKETISEFELMQNYPNPFNPTTKIKYKVSEDASVKLKVFNVLGEEIITLVDNYLNPGIYEAQFNAESLPSGYYIYSLIVNNQIIENKKMILIK